MLKQNEQGQKYNDLLETSKEYARGQEEKYEYIMLQQNAQKQDYTDKYEKLLEHVKNQERKYMDECQQLREQVVFLRNLLHMKEHGIIDTVKNIFGRLSK